MLQSNALDKNETTSSSEEEEDDGASSTLPVPSEGQELRVVLGTQPLITATALVKQFQKDYSIFWSPDEMPIVIEDDDEDNEFRVAYKSHVNDDLTIIFHFSHYMSDNEDFDDSQPESDDNPRQIYGFDWLNIEEFRQEFAETVLQSIEDVRMTYFIITAFYGRCDVNAVNYEFSRDKTINMEFETVKYWRIIPPRMDATDVPALVLYQNDTVQLSASIQERYRLITQLITQLIHKNNNDISNRIFRNRMFYTSVQRTHEGIMQTIEQANETIQREAQERAAQLEEHSLALATAIEENQQNALAIIDEQKSLIEESKSIIDQAIEEARTAMEHTTEEIQQQHEEFETRIAEFKEARDQTIREVSAHNNLLSEYKADNSQIITYMNEFKEEFEQRIEAFKINQSPTTADFKLDIPSIITNYDGFKNLNNTVIEHIKSSSLEIGNLTQTLLQQIIEKRKIAAQEDQEKYLILRDIATNIISKINTIKQSNVARLDKARLALVFNTYFIKKMVEVAHVPAKRTDFSQCIDTIKQLSVIAESEWKSSESQEAELAHIMDATQYSIDSFLNTLEKSMPIGISQPMVNPVPVSSPQDLNDTKIMDFISSMEAEKSPNTSPEPKIVKPENLAEALAVGSKNLPPEDFPRNIPKKPIDKHKKEETPPIPIPDKLTPEFTLNEPPKTATSSKKAEKGSIKSVKKTIAKNAKCRNVANSKGNDTNSDSPTSNNRPQEDTTPATNTTGAMNGDRPIATNSSKSTSTNEHDSSSGSEENSSDSDNDPINTNDSCINEINNVETTSTDADNEFWFGSDSSQKDVSENSSANSSDDENTTIKSVITENSEESNQDESTDLNNMLIELCENVKEKLKSCDNCSALKRIIVEIKSSPIFRCFKDKTIDASNLMGLSILTIMIGITGVIPPAEPTGLICGYPGCMCTFTRGNDRVSHWRNQHGKEAPEVNFTSCIEGITGIFTSWSQFSQKKGNIPIHTPCICPLCQNGDQAICQNNHAFKQHITNSTDALHRRCKELSKNINFTWAVIITCILFNKKLTPTTILSPIDGLSCPYCSFISKFKNQVSSHISTSHRDKMTDINQRERKDLPIKVRINILRSLEPIRSINFSTPIHNSNDSPPQTTTQQQQQQQPTIANTNTSTSDSTDSDAFDDFFCPSPTSTEENHTPNNNLNVTASEQQSTTTNQNNNYTTNEQSKNHTRKKKQPSSRQQTAQQNLPTSNTSSNQQTENSHLSVTMEEIRNAKAWRINYSDNEIALPRLRKKQREKVAPLISKYWEFEAVPSMKRFLNNDLNIPNKEKWEAIDGLISKIEHDVVEIIKRKFKFSGQRKNRVQNKDESQLEINYSNLSRYKTAASNSATMLKTILETKCNEDINENLKFNTIEDLKDRCLCNIRKIDPTVSQELFGKSPSEVDHTDIDNFVDQDINQFQARIQWLSNTIDQEHKDLEEISAKRKRASEKKAQEIYAEDCKRAMRWFVTRNGTPACSIKLDQIEDELSRRWCANNGFERKDESTWHANQIPKELAERIDKMITEVDRFHHIIETRSKQSANGPDGIGYAIMQMGSKHSAKLMSLISKAMLKYGKFPSRWLSSRSILLYKHGDPSALSNWRPLTISSCVYRIWAGAVASAIQEINAIKPLFAPAQKGFVAGVNGCLEHTTMINEIIASANRSKRNLYILTIDLKDAFGSLPHSYINTILDESGFSKSFKKVIMESYNGATTKIWLNGKASNPIPINKGVKQGCPFSPLLFNLCLNPLIRELSRSTRGYRIGNNYHTVQAYADDIVLFSETRDDMIALLNEVNNFIRYSKLEINVKKCHSASYILQEGHRVSDSEPFTFNNNNIPNHNLSEWVEYLGTAAATTINIRRKSTEATLTDANNLVDLIFNSPLRINQMIDAVKRFVIPSLDYTLTEGSPRLGDLKALDTKIRTKIAKHIGVPNIPIAFAYSHWFNGGLSLQPLETRAKALKVKSFIAMMNSKNVSTKLGFRDCTQEEMQHRGIKSVEVNDSKFLDWETNENGEFIATKHGTSALCARAKEAADKCNIRITYGNDNAAGIIVDNMFISNPKEIAAHLLRVEMDKSFNLLLNSQMHGHSFVNARGNRNANSIIGNYSHNISDKIISFALAARTNELATGNILSKKANHNTAEDQGCPYCHLKGKEDTLSHRLNGCKSGRSTQTIRHNMVVKEILEAARNRFKTARIRSDQAIRINNNELAIQVNNKTYRPDIFIENDKTCHIIEVTVPYDGMTNCNGRNITILEARYIDKMNKYESLRIKAEQLFGKQCTLTTVVVSSLGILYPKSMESLQKLLMLSRSNKNILERRISVAAIIGSFFVFYNIKKDKNQNREYEIDNEAAGNPAAEEP